MPTNKTVVGNSDMNTDMPSYNSCQHNPTPHWHKLTPRHPSIQTHCRLAIAWVSCNDDRTRAWEILILNHRYACTSLDVTAPVVFTYFCSHAIMQLYPATLTVLPELDKSLHNQLSHTEVTRQMVPLDAATLLLGLGNRGWYKCTSV